jgi:hypothetical protein
MNYLYSIILYALLFCFNIFPQNPPPDFKLVGTTGGTTPWSISETITILADGQVSFYKFREGGEWDILKDTTFTIPVSNVQQIWQAIQNNNFFSLSSTYQDDTLQDGSFALFTITANSTTKQVRVKNILQDEIESIINSINSNIPESYNLNYTTPEKINIIPTEPCDQQFGFSPDLLKKIFPNKYRESVNPDYRFVSTDGEIQIPHGGIVVGYEMSLFDAVAAGIVSLSSKGEFYGDAVSIMGNFPKNYSPPNNNISIKLYLEFYGPCANTANVGKIVADILNKWDGHTTGGGKTVQMEVITLSHPGKTAPPGTPGYNNIKIECGEGTSTADLGTPNTDEVSTGTWYADSDPGLFAHEAGHLMGLVDQYDGYVKLPDGSWVNELDANEKYSAEEFLNQFKEHFPELDSEKVQKIINNNQRITWPKPGQENNVMADFTKPPLQSDINLLASQAGLIINITAGDILLNPFISEQNLVVTHSEDLFLKPGEEKTLNGIYAACIDFHRGIPDSADLFHIAPSLDKWEGIPSAKDLLKLIKYVDSISYFCESYHQSQGAIWRITDNSNFSSEDIYNLFNESGININNKIFNFPRLINNSTIDINSKAVVPNELFFPDIQPEIVLAGIGENLTYNATISKPSGFNFTTGFSWVLEPPVNSLSQISSNGSFVPDKKGIYTISVNINITDPANNVNEYTPELKAYAVVPDRFTETFENPNLSYRFQWETFGDSEWEITNTESQTGSYSVRSGEVLGGQSTTLAINVNLQQDSMIAFARKMFMYNTGRLSFDIDSNFADYWASSSDWEFFEYELKAGEHRLTWEFINYSSTPSTVWLDNIFFPANSVITGIEHEEKIPLAFNLYQNYPNPFNPTTKIKYTIPSNPPDSPLYERGGGEGFVTLKIYDILGKEIALLVNEIQPPGEYEIEFDASGLSSGVYFYQLKVLPNGGQAKDLIQTRKMVLLR